MSRQLGRISGPLLSNDLLRNGVDLAFETDLLYLKVSPVTRLFSAEDYEDPNYPGTSGSLLGSGIGIRTDAVPDGKDLFVNSYIRTVGLNVDTFTVPNFSITTDNIQQLTGILYLRPDQTSNPEITAVALGTTQLRFDNNEIYALNADTDINFSPISSLTNIRTSVLVDGNLHVTGTIKWDGDITIGDSNTDNIVFKSDIDSDIIPNQPDAVPLLSESGNFLISESNDRLITDYLEVFSLGTPTQQWLSVNSEDFSASFTYNDLSSVGVFYPSNFRISSNEITNMVLNDPMYLAPNGTGRVKFNDNKYIDGSEIINQYNTPLTLANTGPGYMKFAGTYGVRIPVGPTLGPEGAELGMIRYNTDLGFVRVFNGTEWVGASGSLSSLSQEEVSDIMDVWTIILG